MNANKLGDLGNDTTSAQRQPRYRNTSELDRRLLAESELKAGRRVESRTEQGLGSEEGLGPKLRMGAGPKRSEEAGTLCPLHHRRKSGGGSGGSGGPTPRTYRNALTNGSSPQTIFALSHQFAAWHRSSRCDTTDKYQYKINSRRSATSNSYRYYLHLSYAKKWFQGLSEEVCRRDDSIPHYDVRLQEIKNIQNIRSVQTNSANDIGGRTSRTAGARRASPTRARGCSGGRPGPGPA
ncbi:hypothetical protein EVAR_13126_1 [Eumeta japonica]|uniref:Uncharacterized protein n=1 Tax=Eumeta variegata TaxID=151549 RepID=A0A4C1UB13_EUMVA|nr:hypothetical protein EVAR_13126_1 [Eumeta japonica]